MEDKYIPPVLGNEFRTNREYDDTGLKYLFMEWNFPKDFIILIWEKVGNKCSFDEANDFLRIYDGADNFEEAVRVWLYEIDETDPECSFEGLMASVNNPFTIEDFEKYSK
jgi:hypothetical protein